MTDTYVDHAYSGATLTPDESARRTQRWGVFYYVRRELLMFRAWAAPTILYSVATPLLYIVALGIGLGTLVNKNAGGIDGVPYLVFVAPAILISTVAMSATGDLSYPVVDGFKWSKSYFGAAATPLSPWQIAVGHFLAAMVRFALMSALFVVMMMIFGAVRSPWAALVIPAGVATAMAMGAPMQAFAASQDDEGANFNIVMRFIVMPMTLFAGTYYPLDIMPIYLQWIGWISPLWHGSQLARLAAYGHVEPWWLTLVHVAVLLAFTVVGLLLSARIYTKRLGA